MKEKKWIFFRVMAYMCIAGAALALIIFVYYASSWFRSLRSFGTTQIIMLSGWILQIIFNILNVRLIHYYLFQKFLPEKAFSIWHTLLVVINSCIALGLLAVFIFGAIETFTAAHSNHHFNTGDVWALVVVTAYTFVTVSTIVGAIRLRNYLRKYTAAREEEWLQQLGS